MSIALPLMLDEQTIFNAARQMEPSLRAAYLSEVCDVDDALRQRVKALLRVHDDEQSFMASPAAGLDGQVSLDPPALLTPAGTIIGRYKILEPIGEGGYGVVFMAEQTTPVQRKVALKIIKAGMDTRQVIARFEAERQALALMDHPNIAKVFDAGMTDTGQLYFVMELVKGIAITKYCDEHRLEPRQRLELFMQVCQAVQHAHQKGIIHRDIKPNNVLVAQYDGKPVPKVIDFGVAKATGQQLTERTMFTGFGDVIGTLEYMSPEQAEVNQLDVDTRSDIYSLGVLLYELLTGTTPLEHKRVLKAGLLEMLRVVREEEPPKPSMRLTATVELPSIAACRGLEPRSLSGIVKGELDWIVMRALEKDRSRRYETANGMAMDIQRYLNDDTVHACPPSASYRFRKFARRNKGILTASAAVIAALLIGTIASTWQAVRATRYARAETAALALARANERAANENAAKAEAARQRAEKSFREARLAFKRVLADAVAADGKWAAVPLAARKVLAEDAMRFYLKFVKETDPEPAVRFETASSLRAIALMRERVGETELAEKTYRQSVDILVQLLAQFPTDREYRAQLGLDHRLLAQLLLDLDRLEEAGESYRTAVKLYEGLLDEMFNPDHLFELAECYAGLTSIDPSPQNVQSLSASILRRFEQSGLEQAQSRFDAGNRYNTNPLSSVALFLANVPDPAQRRPLRAIELARKATELSPQFHGAWNTLGVAHYRAGNWKAAVAALEKSASLSIGDDPYDRFFLAMAQWQLGNQEEARRQYDLGVAVVEGRPGEKRALRRVRAEAAALLNVREPVATTRATAKRRGGD
jgi:serine/threonine protein kinase/tetratricopeptide (TPR) repeat protein